MSLKQMVSMLLMLWNVFVFLSYGLDKGKARRGGYRTPEKYLLLMSYLGGGLGAWAGGTHFRHKTQKVSFQLAWAAGVVVDGLLIYWIWR